MRWRVRRMSARAYQRLSQREHVLLRPDMYIGPVRLEERACWLAPSQRPFRRVALQLSPGLLSVVDEVLVNAADNAQREGEPMTYLHVTVGGGQVTVSNDGPSIPTTLHPEERVPVPQLVFGVLLTSSNYDDTVERFTGGRHGYGAKLTNIMSSCFSVEIRDRPHQQVYRQTFSDNMASVGAPEVYAAQVAASSTTIAFQPDLSRFHGARMDSVFTQLLRRRAFDLKGLLPHVDVRFNGTQLQCPSFEAYARKYPVEALVDCSAGRWRVLLGLGAGTGLEQTSFVNGVATTRGGKHVDLVAHEVAREAARQAQQQGRAEQLKVAPAAARRHLWLFLQGRVSNPAFDGQTKEKLVSEPVGLSMPAAKLKAAVQQLGIVDRLVEEARAKQRATLRKRAPVAKKGKTLRIPKLEDANWAGTKDSAACTLILTEGDSAKALAVAGLGEVGRDAFGVFPLKGKMLNVRDANMAALLKNEELSRVKTILGLQHGEDYTEDRSALRYGRVLLMADQDEDGSHIKGLFLNFIHYFWPSLLHTGFVQQFRTPLIKATPKGGESLAFYDVPSFEAWRATSGPCSVKYYKGLGTSTSREARGYFGSLDKHIVQFTWDVEDGGDELMETAFGGKASIERRKRWVEGYRRVEATAAAEQGVAAFLEQELAAYSAASNRRSIPHLMDGLKPGQRKVLYASMQRGDEEIKVAQLAGFVAEKAMYHHGEVSLQSTIVGMAARFVGSNNVSLLSPIGQFGTRHVGGKDAASARYIYTRLEPLARRFFDPRDNVLLDTVQEEGSRVEPAFYVPIVPWVLVSGAHGIGTGFSTSIPRFSPMDLCANIRRWLHNEPMQPLLPWELGFTGTIAPHSALDCFRSSGQASKISSTEVEVTELPIGKWTHDFKTGIEKLYEEGLHEVREFHTDKRVRFRLRGTKALIAQLEEKGLCTSLGLHSNLHTSNMHLYSPEGELRLYTDPLEVMEAFLPIRLEYYDRRRAAELQRLEDRAADLRNQVQFISDLQSGVLCMDSSSALLAALQSSSRYANQGLESLLRMPISAMSGEAVARRRDRLTEIQHAIACLTASTPTDLWLQDLAALEAELEAFVAAEESEF